MINCDNIDAHKLDILFATEDVVSLCLCCTRLCMHKLCIIHAATEWAANGLSPKYE